MTELLRLANYIPDVFMLQATGKPGAIKYYIGSTVLDNQGMLRYAEQLKYLKILFDLDYVKNQDQYD